MLRFCNSSNEINSANEARQNKQIAIVRYDLAIYYATGSKI